MYDTFENQVIAAGEDLNKYPHDQLIVLAQKMGIPSIKNKQGLCQEIARKIIFIHGTTLPESDRAKCSRYKRTLTNAELSNIRKSIYDKFKTFKNSVTAMSSDDLRKFFYEYDRLCFNGDITKFMSDSNYTLGFKTSGEDTFTTEGICARGICNYVITIPTMYFGRVTGMTNVAGHQCKDQLECLQRVVEHELVHLIIFIFCGDSFITDQHGPMFMDIAKNLFAHTDHRHYIF